MLERVLSFGLPRPLPAPVDAGSLAFAMFEDGSFSAHNVPLRCAKGLLNAMYDPSGELLLVEEIGTLGIHYPIPRGTETWNAIQGMAELVRTLAAQHPVGLSERRALRTIGMCQPPSAAPQLPPAAESPVDTAPHKPSIAKAVIERIIARRVWIESDVSGARHVMAQYDAPGSQAVCLVTLYYDHTFTNNAQMMADATVIAKRLGATDPVEELFRAADLAGVGLPTPADDSVLRRVPEPQDGGQIETGPVQFGNDAPGVFIRGDTALTNAMLLHTVLTADAHSPALSNLAFATMASLYNLFRRATICLPGNRLPPIDPNAAQLDARVDGVSSLEAGAERDQLRALCAAVYQAAGAYDLPVRILDALSDAAMGEIGKRQRISNLLPCAEPKTRALLQRAESAIAWAAAHNPIFEETCAEVRRALGPGGVQQPGGAL